MQQNYFWIEKITNPESEITFKAVLEQVGDTWLSKLDADPGECRDVETQQGSGQCGLATALFQVCFQDEDVTKDGGLNPSKNPDFNAHPEEQQRATSRCAIIVFVACIPDRKTPKKVCSAYLNAASKAGYGSIFTSIPIKEGKMDDMTLDDAIKDFGKTEDSANDFIRIHGWYWYFCKEKPE